MRIERGLILFIITMAVMVGASQYFDIDILPGGMFSDMKENAMGNQQHQVVTNLKQNKFGEWETVKGYVKVDTGFGRIKAGTEITDDRSNDRFLLIQDDTCLVRIDYDNGYMGQSMDTLSLPMGVVCDTSDVLPITGL